MQHWMVKAIKLVSRMVMEHMVVNETGHEGILGDLKESRTGC